MTAPAYERAPDQAEATSNISALNYSTSTAVGNANPLRGINAEDLINAIRYMAPKGPLAPISKEPEGHLLADLESCTCETEGRCAPCDRLPLVLRQRLTVSDLQTTRTVNSSPMTWNSSSREPQREWQ